MRVPDSAGTRPVSYLVQLAGAFTFVKAIEIPSHPKLSTVDIKGPHKHTTLGSALPSPPQPYNVFSPTFTHSTTLSLFLAMPLNLSPTHTHAFTHAPSTCNSHVNAPSSSYLHTHFHKHTFTRTLTVLYCAHTNIRAHSPSRARPSSARELRC